MLIVENILSYTIMGERVVLRKIILLRHEKKKVLYPRVKKLKKKMVKKREIEKS